MNWEDALFADALEALKGRATISKSGLQRRIRVGFATADHLFLRLEAEGHIGPRLINGHHAITASRGVVHATPNPTKKAT